MMKKTIKLALGILFATSCNFIHAQYEQDIISIGDRELTVRPAYKLKDIPTFQDTLVEVSDIKYAVLPKLVPTTFEAQGIKAAKIKVESPLKRLYRGYVKGAVGTYSTPMFSAHFNSLRSRDWAYGFGAHHFSSNGGINDYAPSGYAQNEIGGWARKALKKHTLEFGLNYDSDKVHYYGFKPEEIAAAQEIEELEFDKEDIEHKLRNIGFHTILKSYYTDSTKINHEIDISYRSSKDNFDSKEGNFRLVADLNTFKDKFKFMLKTTLDVNNFSSLRVEQFDFIDIPITSVGGNTLPIKDNNTILEFAPQINAVVGGLRANIGLGIGFDIDNNSTAVRFSPRGFAKYDLFSNLFTIYVGLDGGLKRNSYASLYEENPFLLSEVNLKNQFTKGEFYAGIRGSISNELSFNAKVSTSSFSGMPLFTNTDTLFSVENRFDVLYAEGSMSRILGELTYQQSEKVKVFTNLEFMNYDLDRQEEAWHKPTTKFAVGASYNLLDKFIITADIFAQGKRFALSQTAEEGVKPDEDGFSIVTLKGFVDSNLKLEYRYTKRVSAFLQFNNITGGKYQRWRNYPVQQFMILGGLSYSF